MEQTRMKRSVKNTVTGLLNYVIHTILTFVIKTVFIYVLGAELLGLNSLFANILTILSLADLGIGSALVFSMYKPMAEQDYAKVNALVKLYKKLYFIIAGIVITIGLILFPFLKYLINADNTLYVNIYILYLMCLTNTVIGYFFAHRKALIFTSQRNDVENIISICINLFGKLAEISIIFIFKNYYAYYATTMTFTLIEGIVTYIASSKVYRHIKEAAGVITKEEKQEIFKSVRGLLCHKIGIAVVTGTDNIIISRFINLTTLGAYSNYILLATSISAVLTMILTAVKASFGNIVATKTPEEVEKTQFKVLFMYSWLTTFCATSLLCLLQPFIKMWLPDQYAISFLTVVMIVLSFSIDKMRNVIQMVRDCAGLFSYKKWCPICEAILNLVASYVLVHFMGLPGVILGTIIGYVVFPLLIEPYVVYKYYYKKGMFSYWKKWLLYFLLGVAIATVTYLLCLLIPGGGIWWFIVKCAICLIVPNGLMTLFYFKTDEFKYYVNLSKGFLSKVFKRNKNK